MKLTKQQLSLPTHILQALQGQLSASNSISANDTPSRYKALNSTPITINLADSINAIDSPYYELEAHTLEGDNTHIDLT